MISTSALRSPDADPNISIGWSSAIKNANCCRSWPELAIVAVCWRTTGKSEVIHFDENRPNRTLVREKVLSGLIVQFADYTTKWIASGLLTPWWSASAPRSLAAMFVNVIMIITKVEPVNIISHL